MTRWSVPWVFGAGMWGGFLLDEFVQPHLHLWWVDASMLAMLSINLWLASPGGSGRAKVRKP